MKNESDSQKKLAAIESAIVDAIDEYNAAVAAGNDELAQMIHLSIQGLKRRRDSSFDRRRRASFEGNL
jgi:hypothetical protein